MNYKYRIIIEITGVFIGITLAFFTNNIKTNIESSNKEINYIDMLLDDTSYNISELKDRIEADTSIIKKSSKIIEELYFNRLSKSSYIEAFNLMSSFSRLKLKQTTYNEIINNGDFNVFSNDSIKRLIIETKTLSDDIMKRENFYEDFYQTHTLPYIMSNFNIILKQPIDDYSPKDLYFQNNIAVNRAIKQQIVEKSYQDLLVKSILLKDLLVNSMEK